MFCGKEKRSGARRGFVKKASLSTEITCSFAGSSTSDRKASNNCGHGRRLKPYTLKVSYALWVQGWIKLVVNTIDEKELVDRNVEEIGLDAIHAHPRDVEKAALISTGFLKS